MSFCLAWFFLSLSVESLVPQKDVLFEHRLYLPMAGFSLLFTIEFLSLFKNHQKFILAISIIILTYCYLTIQRNRVWADGISLWHDVARKSPYKARPFYNLATNYIKKHQFDKAIQYYSKAIRYDPESVEAYNNRGAAYYNKGLYDLALKDYESAYRLNPDDAVSLYNIGEWYALTGQYRLALNYLNRAVAIEPRLATAYVCRGAVFLNLGDKEKAREEFQKVEQMKPQGFRKPGTLEDSQHWVEIMNSYKTVLQGCGFKW